MGGRACVAARGEEPPPRPETGESRTRSDEARRECALSTDAMRAANSSRCSSAASKSPVTRAPALRAEDGRSGDTRSPAASATAVVGLSRCIGPPPHAGRAAWPSTGPVLAIPATGTRPVSIPASLALRPRMSLTVCASSAAASTLASDGACRRTSDPSSRER